MGLTHPTWVEASYASPPDRVEVCCLSLLGRLAVDPMRLGCRKARAVGRFCHSIVGVLLLADSSIPRYFGLTNDSVQQSIRGSPRRRAGRGSVTMAMGGGPPLHRRPRGAGAAETTSWAVGGAPHMSPTPIWLVGIVARRPSGRRG